MSRHEPTDCPFCGEPNESFVHLARHMCQVHRGREVGSSSLMTSARDGTSPNDRDMPPVPGNAYWIDCWCQESYFGLQKFADHLQTKGMPQHFLNTLFGVPILSFKKKRGKDAGE